MRLVTLRQALWAMACALCVLSAGPMEAQAAGPARRYALVIGNNTGGPDEQRLRYAEQDARRLGDVLEGFGQIPKDRVLRLYGATADQLEATFTILERRITADRAKHGDAETLLLLYYSGHAANDGLHMRGTTLSLRRLKELVRQAPADMRVLILDACNSGEITRVKGAKRVPSIPLHQMTRSGSSGMAILTSATAHEKAQESDRLRGSYFTHHLLTGLKGAADQSRDGRVSLAEVYQYAYQETLRATTRARYVQHPTYSFELKGRQDLVLTHLAARAGTHGQLRLATRGSYVLFEGDASGAIVADLFAKQVTDLSLKPGRYAIRMRDADAKVWESTVTVRTGRTTKLTRAAMRRVPLARVVRKGGASAAPLALSVRAGVLGTQGLTPVSGPLVMPRLGVGLDFETWTLVTGLRYGRRQVPGEFLGITETALGIDVAGLLSWDYGALSTGAGARVSALYLTQDFQSVGRAPSRATWSPQMTGLAHLTWSPLAWLSVSAQGGIGAGLLPEDSGQWGPSLVTELGLGVSIYAF